ncbi:MAG: preprotein translocase subunit SecY [Lachnospiraceae bacterium]|nr:preprotein translocase subunit SecY [Lachnospiraceae bacterium]
MFETLINALKIKDIRKKLGFTFFILVVVRLGCQLPIPGIDTAQIQAYLQQALGDSFSLLNSFTGGSFLSMSLFALNVTPYITSSIIIQLLTIAIPALEEMHRDGEDGRKKLAKITRYVTIALSILEGGGIAISFGRQGLLGEYNAMTVITMVCALTAGSAMVMWLGERITENGIGNGISIILLINIVSRMPNDFYGLYQKFIQDKQIGDMVIAIAIILGVILGTVILTILLQDAERRIPVQYSKKLQGRKMVGGQATHIPLKVNTAGVIPIIFASSLLQFPIIISQFFTVKTTSTAGKIIAALNQSNWCDPEHPKRSIGLLIYIVLVILFAYFYTSITFNPIEVSNNMKKQGGFIPGIRPGRTTTDYLNRILNSIIFIGAVGLTIIAVIPIFFNGVFGADVSFGGTSLIIVVGVVLETIKQMESQMLVRHYSGFLSE